MKSAEDSTVLGKSVVIHGELSGSEDLLIDGEMQGTITLAANRLTVGPNGRIHADITVQDLVVFGQVNGNIHASGRIELRQTARVIGDVFASRLSIEESAMIKGKVELTGGAPAAMAAPTEAAPGVTSSKA